MTLARLDDLVRKAGKPRPQRVGLSATVRPIDAVARFLQGTVHAEASEPPATAVLRDRPPGQGDCFPSRPPSARRRRLSWQVGRPGRGPFPPTPPSALGAPMGRRPGPAAPPRSPGPDPAAASVTVIDSGHRRRLDLAVEVPRDELGVVATNEMWGEIYDRIAELILAHRTTLVFVNTRRLCERVAHHLEERLGDEAVLAHHGSLSRRIRQGAERRLKSGELRAVVATASLELGIDVGTVDLVCQIGSPRSIAVALQRVGRSGHHVDTPDGSHVPRGRLFATTRDELVECAALVYAIRQGRLDRLEIPEWPLDVLAQQLVAACASETWAVEELFALVRTAAPYAALPRPAFEAVVDMLSDGIATSRGRSGAYLHRDRGERHRPGAARRPDRRDHGGAARFPTTPTTWWWPSRTRRRWGPSTRTSRSRAWRATSSCWAPPRGASAGWSRAGCGWRTPTAPPRRFRSGAGRPRGAPPELSEEVSRLRERIAEMAGEPAVGTGREDRRLTGRSDGPGSASAEGGTGVGDGGDEGLNRAAVWLTEACGLDRAGAEQAAAYVRAGAAVLGAVPADRTVVAERFFDEGGRHAARRARPVRRPHQPRVGARAPQAVLPLVQLRAAGGGHRQRGSSSRSPSSTASPSRSSSGSSTSTPSRRC